MSPRCVLFYVLVPFSRYLLAKSHENTKRFALIERGFYRFPSCLCIIHMRVRQKNYIGSLLCHKREKRGICTVMMECERGKNLKNSKNIFNAKNFIKNLEIKFKKLKTKFCSF